MDTQELKPQNGLATLNQSPGEINSFSAGGFDHAQRVAKLLADSTLVPDVYRGKISNCMIALEMAGRINASPLMVMQNLHVIQGRPSWSSPFIIATINNCGRFTKLNFRQVGEKGKDSYGYEAFCKDKKTGEELVSPVVDWEMVKAEGWLSKAASKWKSMPELMFRYRTAAFFGRLHCPEILMGMHTTDEVIDIEAQEVPQEVRESKEAERVTLMIQDARSLAELEKVRDHVRPEQMELFNTKIKALS